MKRKSTPYSGLTDGVPKVKFGEFLGATICALPLSFIIAAFLNYKILHRIAHKLRISKKFGDLDVWGFTFTMPGVEWIIVRDIKHNLAYEGWVQAFSPTFSQNEILLRDVKVFRNDDTSTELYSVGGLYISRESNDLTIELAVPLTELEERPPEGGEENESAS